MLRGGRARGPRHRPGGHHRGRTAQVPQPGEPRAIADAKLLQRPIDVTDDDDDHQQQRKWQFRQWTKECGLVTDFDAGKQYLTGAGIAHLRTCGKRWVRTGRDECSQVAERRGLADLRIVFFKL